MCGSVLILCFLSTPGAAVVVGGCGQDSISDLNKKGSDPEKWQGLDAEAAGNMRMQTRALISSQYFLLSVSFLLHTEHLLLAFQGRLSWSEKVSAAL